MSNVIASLEKVLLPFAVKIGKQPHVNAIKNSFIRLMPLTLAGAMFVLINNVFLSFGEGSFFFFKFIDVFLFLRYSPGCLNH